jgi:hypothetical protein
MAIGFIAPLSTSAADGNSATISSGSISGAGIVSGDLLIVASSVINRSTGAGAISVSHEIVNTVNGNRLRVGWDFWDGSSGVTATGTANTNDAISLMLLSFSGADLTTPINLTATPATGASTNPNCPAIVPTVDDCAIVVFAGSNASDAAVTLGGAYTLQSGSAGTDTASATVHGGYNILVGGNGVSEDPPAFGSWVNSSWVAATIALQPAGGASGQPAVKRMGGVMGANYRSPFGMWRELLLPPKLRWI